MTAFDLTGKVAIITGASRGIGAAIAWAYARAGARLLLSSRKLENVQLMADAINAEFPQQALALAAHAGEAAAARALVAAAVDSYGRLDIVVNNAATNPHFGPILTAEESHWDKILQVNLKGAFWVCQAAVRQMQQQGSGGKIVNVASIAGIRPGAMMGIYSVSKAALIMLTKVLASEVGSDNIQVNAIAPGFVKTKFSAALWQNPAVAQALIAQTPAGRMAEPDEITGIALYLASAASDFTTGAVFTIDGGYTI